MINRPRQTEVGITIVYTHSVHVTSLKSPFAQRFPAFENHLSSLIHQAWWHNVIIHSFWLLIFISCDIINPTISVCFPRISFSKKKKLWFYSGLILMMFSFHSQKKTRGKIVEKCFVTTIRRQICIRQLRAACNQRWICPDHSASDLHR